MVRFFGVRCHRGAALDHPRPERTSRATGCRALTRKARKAGAGAAQSKAVDVGTNAVGSDSHHWLGTHFELLEQFFGDLDSVQRGALEQLIS